MSAKGTPTFIAQRASAVLLLPLVAWLLWGLVAHAGADYEAARAWLSDRLNAGLLAALIAISAFHMRIGLNEVIEDYIHAGAKGVLMTLNTLAALAVAGAGIWAAWRLAF
ncbi:MAG: succinate dehydrogenase, hydrophobic membrane anchor protein [Alphaproteobacteria bacterium]|nr:succinate dehydrogenase, hydrophobic membrane anchor protein [Alphaproteobacteria bacterium]